MQVIVHDLASPTSVCTLSRVIVTHAEGVVPLTGTGRRCVLLLGCLVGGAENKIANNVMWLVGEVLSLQPFFCVEWEGTRPSRWKEHSSGGLLAPFGGKRAAVGLFYLIRDTEQNGRYLRAARRPPELPRRSPGAPAAPLVTPRYPSSSVCHAGTRVSCKN